MPRIYGLETEYGLVGLARAEHGVRRLTADDAAQRLFALVARENRSTNVFLRNGGRLYLDVGSHPEYATAECASPADLVVAERAGDAIVARLAERAAEAEAAEGRDVSFALFKNNVDAHGNTFGSHENYLVGRGTDPEVLSRWLIGFLVSRQLIAGAGRWRRGTFTLSQRCDVLGDVVSNQTTRSRPLINTRDEPHADPAVHRRLHVISGDSNLSEAASALKVGATELVLRLAESGRPAPPGPADPLSALRAWGHDPDAAVELVDGTSASCRDVQERYCAFARDVAEDAEWTPWRDTLDALARGEAPPAAEWAVKRRLIETYRDRHGLADADPRLDALDLRWHELGRGPGGRPLGLARLLEERGALPRLSTPDAVADAARSPASPTRAVVRARLLAAAQAAERSYAADWASFTVHDLPAAPGDRRPADVTLRLDDPFATRDAAADDLAGRMRSEPRARLTRGFVPPGPSTA
ncbi:proteasome accessory factor PafA2 family protein [Nigerium massiliense]|uniref:proteasome accessory factor PafA2 family protein n=1 Tax=Nigerium massiliense TaxID=1522317 RepID=UPI00069368C7|nr:proteasome accessory factor PafA2 family protein [Nigerium massiliense]